MFAGSPRGPWGVPGNFGESVMTCLGEMLAASESGGGAMGNLNSDNATEGVLGDGMEPMAGVFGTVDAPEGRRKGEPLSGGYEALYKGEVGVLKDRSGCEAVKDQQGESIRLEGLSLTTSWARHWGASRDDL